MWKLLKNKLSSKNGKCTQGSWGDIRVHHYKIVFLLGCFLETKNHITLQYKLSLLSPAPGFWKLGELGFGDNCISLWGSSWKTGAQKESKNLADEWRAAQYM